MSTEYVHVRDLDTGHQYPIPVDRFDPAAHKKTGKPATGPSGRPVPIKFHVPRAASAEKE